jgi:hypothetical protein
MRVLFLIYGILFFISTGQSMASAPVTVIYDRAQAPVAYAVGQLSKALTQKNKSLITAQTLESKKLPSVWVVTKGEIPRPLAGWISKKDFEGLNKEGYELRWVNNKRTLLVISSDEIGAEYGLLDVVDFVNVHGSFDKIAARRINPKFEYRIVKFNLPWSPYRISKATEVHMQTCRDIRFWEKFLDMMAENRLNALSLWNNHPFPYMIRSKNFPLATGFDAQEMQEWQRFWKQLFSMAKQRGIQTYVINWNIVVSPEFTKAYGGKEYSDLSDQIKQYTKESVTQMIDEYEDLTGIGVTLADWMGNFPDKLTPQEREDWIDDTFVAGMKAAKRPVKFIHRSVLAGDPLAMRELISKADLKDPALVEIKFNWSHGHSTPGLSISHDYHSGKLDERFWTPQPKDYKIQWMIRNEDFFILRWGQPDFIRQHIALNSKDYVNGYFIGSEGYIPAADYSHKASPDKTWEYAFEKQWLFYKVWGKLLFDPNTSDTAFTDAFDIKYGKKVGLPLLNAYKLASNMPLRLASFYRSTWDYTLYSEGFIEAEPAEPRKDFDRTNPLISIDEFMDHPTLDPSMLSIAAYVDSVLLKKQPGKNSITPMMLADSSENDSRKALQIVKSLRLKGERGALVSELDDVTVWSHLGLYFADKLRAGVALRTFYKTGDTRQKQQAIDLLEQCLLHWDQVIKFTKDRYLPTPHVMTQNYGEDFQVFSWELMRPQVENDINLAKKAVFKL